MHGIFSEYALEILRSNENPHCLNTKTKYLINNQMYIRTIFCI